VECQHSLGVHGQNRASHSRIALKKVEAPPFGKHNSHNIVYRSENAPGAQQQAPLFLSASGRTMCQPGFPPKPRSVLLQIFGAAWGRSSGGAARNRILSPPTLAHIDQQHHARTAAIQNCQRPGDIIPGAGVGDSPLKRTWYRRWRFRYRSSSSDPSCGPSFPD